MAGEELTVPRQVRAFIGQRAPLHSESIAIDSLLGGAEAKVRAISA